MHFRHISAKIQLKNLKQHFDWGGRGPGPVGPPGYALARAHILFLWLYEQVLGCCTLLDLWLFLEWYWIKSFEPTFWIRYFKIWCCNLFYKLLSFERPIYDFSLLIW